MTSSKEPEAVPNKFAREVEVPCPATAKHTAFWLALTLAIGMVSGVGIGFSMAEHDIEVRQAAVDEQLSNAMDALMEQTDRTIVACSKSIALPKKQLDQR